MERFAQRIGIVRGQAAEGHVAAVGIFEMFACRVGLRLLRQPIQHLSVGRFRTEIECFIP